MHGARPSRDQVQQAGRGMILPSRQVHDAGELTWAPAASVLVVPHVLVNPRASHTHQMEALQTDEQITPITTIKRHRAAAGRVRHRPRSLKTAGEQVRASPGTSTSTRNPRPRIGHPHSTRKSRVTSLLRRVCTSMFISIRGHAVGLVGPLGGGDAAPLEVTRIDEQAITLGDLLGSVVEAVDHAGDDRAHRGDTMPSVSRRWLMQV